MKTQVTTEVEVPDDWIDLVVRHADMFSHSYIGYWAYGRRPVTTAEDECEEDMGDTPPEALAPPANPRSAWLVYEMGDDGQPSNEDEDRAVLAYRAGQPLPEGWHVLDEAAAARAHVEGVKRWGVEWQDGEHADAVGYDVVLQLALLGEVRYG